MPGARHVPRPGARAGAALLAVGIAATVAALLAAPAAAQQPPGAPPALPRHPEITAVVTCGAKVNYAVMSWPGAREDPATSNSERDESRTTAQIALAVSVDGGRSFQELPLNPKHRLDKGNGFKFLGSFPVPAPFPRTLVVRARAAAAWADGSGLGEAKEFGPFLVPKCARGSAAAAIGAGPAGVPVAATSARATPEFDPRTVLAAAATLLALLVAGLWARGRVGRL